MANRPVFCSINKKPFYEEKNIEFKFFPGFSLSQKQKTIDSLHEQYLLYNPNAKILEISSKGSNIIGNKLSAFNLQIAYNESFISVECAFQGGKVFENGGPYVDLLYKSSVEAKKDIRLKNSGKLTKFIFNNIEYPLEPKDLFYNWIYFNALYSDSELSKSVLKYDSFSDIEFNPQKSINCQAKSVAIFVGLVRGNLADSAIKSFDDFKKIVY